MSRLRSAAVLAPLLAIACAVAPPPPEDGGIVRGECPENAVKNEDGLCQCLPGYYPNALGNACVAVDDAGVPDAGLDAGIPNCDPLPFGDAESRAYFDENLKDPMVACSACHRAGTAPTIHANTAYDVAFERVEPEATAPEGTTIGKIWKGNGAVHPAHQNTNFTASEKGRVWIERHLFGVLPESCE